MKSPLLSTWQGIWPEIRISRPLPLGDGVLDESTFQTIEIDELFDVVNQAQTTIGQAVIYRSLAQPSADATTIQDKQAAITELQNNPELKSAIERLVRNAAEDEKNFYLLLFGTFLGSFGTAREDHEIEGFGYLQYRRGIRFMMDLTDAALSLDLPASRYLQQRLATLKNFADSRDYSLMTGPVYISEQGIQSKQDRKTSFSPAIFFRPSIFKPLLIALFFAALWAIGHFFPGDMFKISAEVIPTASIFFVPLLLIYFPIVGGFDRDHCIIPLRKLFKDSQAVADTLDALGELDELLAFTKLTEKFPENAVLPTILTSEHHQMRLSTAINPVLGANNPGYVGNDFSFTDRLVLITGPNSGGKTAFCKTITQIQVLAQCGCYVPAKAAELTVADRIFYQAPEISHLDDGEGRFGTELKRTKAIFLASTEKSLVVLDELSEGTTFEEKLESSTNVLNGFYRKDCSTVLITHNHQLVDHFVKQGTGVAKQVEFAHDQPTYRLIDGISRVSHADRVAKKIGFSKEDIDHYLEESKQQSD